MLTSGTDIIVGYNGMVAAYAPGDLAWILTCTALVWIMIPGLGYLYSGLARRKNALHLLLLTLAALAVTSFQWFFWGYSLAFSSTSGSFLGDLQNFGFMGVLEEPVSGANNKLPEIVYAMYQVSCGSRSAFKDGLLTLAPLPVHVRLPRPIDCAGSRLRARAHLAFPRPNFLLDNRRLRPDRVLGLEPQWLGIQMGRA